MIIDFKMLGKEDKPVLDKFFHARYYENSHLNFTNFYMWRTPYHIQWKVEDDVLYMINEYDGVLASLQPFCEPGKWPEATKKILAFFEEQGRPVYLMGLEKDYAAYLQGEGQSLAAFDVKDDRDNADYVYLAEKLITLSGRKLHSKKNHLNAFHKLYPQAEYLPITSDLIPACRKELESWYAMRSEDLQNDPFIGYERAAIHEVFDNYEAFQLKGDKTWRIAYIEYSSNPKNYRICEADEMMRNFKNPRNIQGVARPQHGSFMRITKKEYKRLLKL